MDVIIPLLVIGAAIVSAAELTLLMVATLGLTLASTVYSYQTAQKAAKDQLKSGGVEITRQDSNAGLTIIYGERAVGGVKVWKDVSNTTFALNPGRTVFGQGNASDGVGKNFKLKAWLNRVDVLGQGPVHSITNIEIDDDSYLSPRFAKRNQAIYRGVFMSGEDSQAALTELAANSDWKTTSTGSGVAYMYSRFRAGHLDDNKIDRYYSAEPMMRYHVKGRLVWDPRDASQSSSDPSTWQWSDNPALCLLDYLTQPYGRNLDYTEIDTQSFITAANSCDISVTIPSTTNETGDTILVWDPVAQSYDEVASGDPITNYRTNQVGTSQKRLTCNAALDPSNPVLENVKILLQSMRGTLPYHNGRYSLKLEDVESVSMAFDEDDIIGGVNFSKGDRSKRFNRTTVVFKNRNKKYKEDRVSWPALDSTEYTTLLAEDNGEELFYEVGLDAVTDYYQAEDLAEFITMSSREQLSAEIKVKSKGLLLEPGDVVEITHSTPGWSARQFRVRAVKFNTDHTVSIGLTEYNASIYTWRTKSQEPLQDDIGLSSPFDDKLPVTNLAAVITRTDTANGVPQGLVDLTFTAPVDESVSEYVVRFKPQGSAVWVENLYPPLQDENTDEVAVQFLAPQHDTVYDLEVNYMDVAGISGEAAVTTFTVPQYRTDIDLDLNAIETETGDLLENEDGSEIVRSNMSDLAAGTSQVAQALDSRVTSTETVVEAQSDSITALQSRVTTNELDITGTSTALDQLTTRVSATEGSIEAQSSDITLLQSDLTTLDGSVTANATGLTDLTTRVTASEGQIESNTTLIESLSSSLTDNDTGLTATADAVDALETRVTQNEGLIESNSLAITTLANDLTDADTGLSVTADAVSALETRVQQNENLIESNSSSITALNSALTDDTTGLLITADAVSTLETRVTDAEGTITTQASDITTLQAAVNDEVTGTVASADAISALDTRVTSTEDSITTQATDITALQTTVNDATTGVAANSTALDALDSRVTQTEDSLTVSSSSITTLQSQIGPASVIHSSGAIDETVNAGTTHLTGVVYQFTPASDVLIGYGYLHVLIDGADTDDAFYVRYTGVDVGIAQVDSEDNNGTEQWFSFPVLTTGAQQTLRIWNTELSSGSVKGIIVTHGGAGDPGSILRGELNEAQITATATAVSDLETSVYEADGVTTAWSGDITTLQSTVNDPTTGVSATASAVSGLETRVSTAEGDITDLEAEYYVDLDVDGHVTGLRLYNTGATSSFTVQASEFKVVAPGASSTEAAPFSVDTAGSISMNANVSVGGDLIVGGSITQTQMGDDAIGTPQIIDAAVDTTQIASNAVTGLEVDFNSSTSATTINATNANPYNSATNEADVTITTEGGPVDLVASFEFAPNTGYTFDATGIQMWIWRYDGSSYTLIYSSNSLYLSKTLGAYPTINYVDSPAAGTYTYYLQIGRTPSYPVYGRFAYLRALELKR